MNRHALDLPPLTGCGIHAHVTEPQPRLAALATTYAHALDRIEAEVEKARRKDGRLSARVVAAILTDSRLEPTL